MNKYMSEAVKEAYDGINAGDGGPFGSVIVKDGKIIGRGHNRVIADHDPTMHGEVAAIRAACANLGTHDLSGCELYTTAEPCPMCLGAILWAGIEKVYYGCNIKDTDKIGFRDEVFYKLTDGGRDSLGMQCVDRDECLRLFDDYSKSEKKKLY